VLPLPWPVTLIIMHAKVLGLSLIVIIIVDELIVDIILLGLQLGLIIQVVVLLLVVGLAIQCFVYDFTLLKCWNFGFVTLIKEALLNWLVILTLSSEI